MDKWGMLGIEATRDKGKIKEAYMERLSVIHPEDDPEGFKLLRATYDELMNLASKEIEERENTPLEQWINKVKNIYDVFSLRLDKDAWSEVLNDEVCLGLDNREEACNKILEFLMESYYLPQSIWILIDETFNIIEKEKELCEYFPKQFINYVVNGIKYKESLNYSLFNEYDKTKNYEEFIKCYFEAKRLIDGNKEQEAKEKLMEIKELDIYHPYVTVLEIKYFLIINALESARALGAGLIENLSDDIEVLSAVAEIEWNDRKFEKASEYYSLILEKYENHYIAKSGLADCILELGGYIEAKKLYREINIVNPYDDYIRMKIYTCNEKIIELYYKELKENPKDSKINFKLIWTLFENFKYKDALEIAVNFKPEENQLCEYYELIGRLYLAIENYEEALSYFDLWVKKIEENPSSEDGCRLSYAHFQKGRVLHILKRYEEALICYNIALEKEPKETFYLNYKAEIFNELKMYRESIDISENSIEIDDSQASAYINRGKSYYELEYYKEAMDDANTAISIYPYFTDAYLIKIKIYHIYNRFEEMLDIIKEVEEFKIETDEIKIYKIRALYNLENIEEAYELGLELVNEILEKKITDKNLINDIYYEMAEIMMYKGNNRKAMEYLDIAIELNGSDLRIESYKAYIYKSMEEFDMAIECYLKLAEKAPDNSYAVFQIGKIYEETNNFEKAIKYFEKAIEIDPNDEYANLCIADIYERLDDMEKAIEYMNRQIEIVGNEYTYIHRGIMYASLNMIEKALDDYNEALKVKPDSTHAYNNIGCIYKDTKEYEKAVEYYKKSIEVNEDDDFVNPYNNIAKCFIEMKNYDEAIEYYNLAIETMPNQISFYINKGCLYRRLKKYEDAIKIFEKALEIDESDIECLEELGETYIYCGNESAAYKEISKIIKIDPNNDSVYFNLAKVEEGRKEYRRAIELMKKQIKIVPNNLSYQIELALLYKKCNKKLSASIILKKVLKKYLAKERPSTCDKCKIGICYVALENTREAEVYLEKALSDSSCKNRPCEADICYEAYIQYGVIAEQENRIEEAIAYFEKAIEIKGELDVDCLYALRRLK